MSSQFGNNTENINYSDYLKNKKNICHNKKIYNNNYNKTNLQEGLIVPNNTEGFVSVSVIGANPIVPTKINICNVPMYLYYNMYLNEYECR